MSKYTDQSRVESYLARELTSDEAILLQPTIEYISHAIDIYTNRNWNNCNDDDTTPVATEKTYDGHGLRELQIDDFSTIESVSLLDDYGNEIMKWLTADVLTLPSNSNTKSSIILKGYMFPRGVANIVVSAVWGSGVVPEAIILIATTMVANNLSSSGGSGYKSESIEGYSYTNVTAQEYLSQNENMFSSLDGYRKIIL